MKKILPGFLFPFLLLVYLPSFAQNLTGIWRGYFITENDDQYKYEIQIEQKGSRISGVSYSYLSTVFYGKATLTGSFNKGEQSALISEIKTIELRMAAGSSACIMKCNFKYAKSGREQFLEGTFTSKFEQNTYGAKKGDDCGSGKVYLRKVPTSDFYIEPFLRGKIKTDSPSVSTNPPVTKKPTTVTKTPPKKNPVATTKKPPVKKPQVVIKKPVTKTQTKSNNNNSSATKITTPEKRIQDSVQKIEVPEIKKEPLREIVTTPDVLKNRENELVKTLVVNSENITVKLYDNGVVDGDSISVYFDKKLVLANKGLSEVPLVINLKIPQDNAEHELVMVALNLGRIPPNTSLMTVESGDQRFNVYITSTEQRNAVVRFKYEKPK